MKIQDLIQISNKNLTLDQMARAVSDAVYSSTMVDDTVIAWWQVVKFLPLFHQATEQNWKICLAIDKAMRGDDHVTSFMKKKIQEIINDHSDQINDLGLEDQSDVYFFPQKDERNLGELMRALNPNK